ncbi:MAG: beta-glucosidase [Actinomycetales bacterium]|jgi:beta-glucosidase|nr:beta-glucosidase [Actinomycetales bacterium]HMT33561.1 GH1 family beta-glucosidase [Dermatophilaceae bacterium]
MIAPARADFPRDFRFGVATAAYQIEGAVTADGRVPSIWDTFTATPGAIEHGDTGEQACDHYHRYAEDVAIMRDLGVDGYRFSIAWPRILPPGGRPNAAGIAFYDRLLDELLAAGITPWATLYHWDLPQSLEDAGGWAARDTAYRFAEYAVVTADAFGDRISHWITLNEPWVSSFLGYASGLHAPGRTDHAAALAAAHHLMLGHGLALDALRAARPHAEVGITLNLTHVEGPDDRPLHDEAIRRTDAIANRIFLDPILRGRYPEDLLSDTAHVTDYGYVQTGDLDAISAPIDFLGVNYYSPLVVTSGVYPGSAAIGIVDRSRPRTGMGWEIDPSGLAKTLTRLTRDYGPMPLVVTENGSAWPDVVGPDGSIDDPGRTAYLQSHLRACLDAIAEGVDLRGYFVWSLLDNFEWSHGYAQRFGIVRVDYDTQRRTRKASGDWYAGFLTAPRGESQEEPT